MFSLRSSGRSVPGGAGLGDPPTPPQAVPEMDALTDVQLGGVEAPSSERRTGCPTPRSSQFLCPRVARCGCPLSTPWLLAWLRGHCWGGGLDTGILLLPRDEYFAETLMGKRVPGLENSEGCLPVPRNPLVSCVGERSHEPNQEAVTGT